jgi:hypothetical protein
MLMKKAVGRNGAERKYDLLTVLGSYALSQGKTLQRQTLRLICLVTARYNWQHDELSVGQADIARLWSVDPRTVKREMAAFRDREWLFEKRAAARGRVTLYGLGISRILEDTRSSWEKVGPDLVARLGATADAPEPVGNVIPFPQTTMPDGDTIWGKIAARLIVDHGAAYQAWFAALIATEGDAGILELRAPSGFHARYVETHFRGVLERAIAQVAPHIETIKLV